MFYEVENKGNMIAGVVGYDSIRKHLVFYEVENKGNMIAGVVGYDSIRKHLGECVP